MTSDFIGKRPEVAKRFAAAWSKGDRFHQQEPDEARKYLAKNTFTPTTWSIWFDARLCHGRRYDPKTIGDLQKLADFVKFDRRRPRKARRHQSSAEILRQRWPGHS